MMTQAIFDTHTIRPGTMLYDLAERHFLLVKGHCIQLPAWTCYERVNEHKVKIKYVSHYDFSMCAVSRYHIVGHETISDEDWADINEPNVNGVWKLNKIFDKAALKYYCNLPANNSEVKE